MRIIGGKFRNRKIRFIKNFYTRPLKDAVKENIFNILEHSHNLDVELKNSIVLDLYSGIGSFGLECFSRGARFIYFVEKNKEALQNLKKNIFSFKIENQTNIYSGEVIKYLENYKGDKKFNIIFLDPPYKNNDFFDILNIIKKKNFLYKRHVILLHREKNSKNSITNKVYGRSEIFFLKLS